MPEAHIGAEAEVVPTAGAQETTVGELVKAPPRLSQASERPTRTVVGAVAQGCIGSLAEDVETAGNPGDRCGLASELTAQRCPGRVPRGAIPRSPPRGLVGSYPGDTILNLSAAESGTTTRPATYPNLSNKFIDPNPGEKYPIVDLSYTVRILVQGKGRCSEVGTGDDAGAGEGGKCRYRVQAMFQSTSTVLSFLSVCNMNDVWSTE